MNRQKISISSIEEESLNINNINQVYIDKKEKINITNAEYYIYIENTLMFILFMLIRISNFILGKYEIINMYVMPKYVNNIIMKVCNRFLVIVNQVLQSINSMI
jgi:hypothetical protein